MWIEDSTSNFQIFVPHFNVVASNHELPGKQSLETIVLLFTYKAKPWKDNYIYISKKCSTIFVSWWELSEKKVQIDGCTVVPWNSHQGKLPELRNRAFKPFRCCILKTSSCFVLGSIRFFFSVVLMRFPMFSLLTWYSACFIWFQPCALKGLTGFLTLSSWDGKVFVEHSICRMFEVAIMKAPRSLESMVSTMSASDASTSNYGRLSVTQLGHAA